MISPSLYYLNQIDLLSGKQRQQLLQYLKDVKIEQEQESIVFGY
jgi:hypothetical protein